MYIEVTDNYDHRNKEINFSNLFFYTLMNFWQTYELSYPKNEDQNIQRNS